MSDYPNEIRLLGRTVCFGPFGEGQWPDVDLDWDAELAMAALSGDHTFVGLVEAVQCAADLGRIGVPEVCCCVLSDAFGEGMPNYDSHLPHDPFVQFVLDQMDPTWRIRGRLPVDIKGT